MLTIILTCNPAVASRILKSVLTYSQFSRARAIPKTGAHRIYGVWGDAYLQERVVVSLLEWSVDADARDFNLDTLDGESATLNDVFAACGNVPFLAERRVIIVRRAEKIEGLGRADGEGESKAKSKKPKVSPTARFAQEADNLAPTTVLIVCRTPESVEVGGKAGVRCIGAQPDKAIEKNGLLINCALGPRETATVAAIVQNEATSRGVLLDGRAAGHLIERCGMDIALLLNELDKCALRMGQGVPITPAVIDEMTRPALQDTIYNLADALGDRQTARAIAVMRELLGDGEPPERILATLTSHLRKLLQARAVLDAGLRLDASLSNRMPRELAMQLPQDGRENIATIASGQSWRVGSLARQARNFTQHNLERALQGAFEVDLALKGIEGDGGADSKHLPELLLELWLTKLG